MHSETNAVPGALAAYLRPHLADLSPYVGVDTVETLAARYGLDPNQVSKLDANENPYGPSPRVYEALARLEHVHHYPDPLASKLRAGIAEYAGVPVEQCLVGAGADELLEVLVRLFVGPGDETADSTPTFSMYRAFTVQNGGVVVEISRRDDWSVDAEAVVAALGPRTKIVWVCSPNNPTGNTMPERDVRRLLDTGLPVVVDEAYHEFAGTTCLPLLAEYPNLIVTRTFSKLAGMAGLRVGYMLAREELIREALKIKQPYNVTVASQAAALASLDDLGRLREHVRAITGERERLRRLLVEDGTLSPYPSEANFLLCRARGGDAHGLREELAWRGVFVRHFSKPRIADCIRVSVGLPRDTDRLLRALAEIGVREAVEV